MGEFQFTKFKKVCQKDLWDLFEPAFSKVETESQSNPSIIADIQSSSPRSFVMKHLFGVFFAKFNEMEEENERLKSKECEKCPDFIKEICVFSNNVTKLSNHCAYLFRHLSPDIQKKLGNNWFPDLSISNDTKDLQVGDFSVSDFDNTSLNDSTTFSLLNSNTPKRSPLTPVKFNSPSLVSPVKDEFWSPVALRSQNNNFDKRDQENLLYFSEGILKSPRSKIGKSKIKEEQNSSKQRTPSPIKIKTKKHSGNRKTSSIENQLTKNLDESDTEFGDVLLPTPPPTLWIKPLTPKSGSGKSRLRNKDKKKMKQQTLISMSKNFPKQTVDISTLKEFRGGSRPTTTENVYPVKRKSDEMIEMNPASPIKLITDKVPIIDPKLEDLDMTAFELPLEMDISLNEPVSFNLEPEGAVQVAADEVQPQQQPLPSTSARSKFKFKASKKDLNLNLTEDLIKDFDKIPERVTGYTDYGKPVRKKEERAKLPGWTCDQCRKYYEGLKSQFHPTEFQRLKNDCSRHRCSRPLDLNETPVDFWLTKFPSTEEAYRLGYIKVGTASPPVPRRRHDMLDD